MGWLVKPDAKASALLLAHGAILGERTLVQGMSKLMPGHTWHWSPQGASMRPRVDLTSNRHMVTDMSEAIEAVDRAFMSSVEAMVAINRVHGCAQVNLLSGGLDSRLVLLATKKHVPAVQSLCFARTGSLDQTIAAEVARVQGTRHHFHSLENGEYMTLLASVKDYDGTVNHLASAHHRSALMATSGLDMGVLASGQTANVLFTDAIPQRKAEVFPLNGVPPKLKRLASVATQESLASSPDAHVAKLWNRSFLSTNSGAYSTRPWGVLWSPFASLDVVKNALAIHPALLANHQLYLSWLAKKHPEAQAHIWERYQIRPALGDAFQRAVWRARWEARIRHRLPWRIAHSMSPVAHWRESTPMVKNWFDDPDPMLIAQWRHHPELEAAVGTQRRSLGVTGESSVLTLLEASRLLFNP
jgi:asparagine synthetase B (glutamine-hydrolysing)